MRYLSVCSGIEAASCAWHSLGWTPVAFSEIEPFPAAVLAHRFPTVPNWGDMTKFKEWPDATVDLLVGGTPCQSFSVAGLRKGLADPRGNLALTYLAIASRYRPAWVVWENVPGVLSDAGNAFGNFLAGLSELGYGWAYRVLDAQYVRVESHPRAVPQRRRRVFVVGHLGDWRRAAAVLFERESLQGHPAPRREAGEGIAGSITRRIDRGGVNSEGGDGHLVPHPEWPAQVAPTFGTSWGDRHPGSSNQDWIAQKGGRFVPDYAIAIQERAGADTNCGHGGKGFRDDGVAYTLEARHHVQSVANSLRADGFDASEDGTGRGTPLIPAVCGTLSDGAHMGGGLNGQDAYSGRIIPVPERGRDGPAGLGDGDFSAGTNRGRLR